MQESSHRRGKEWTSLVFHLSEDLTLILMNFFPRRRLTLLGTIPDTLASGTVRQILYTREAMATQRLYRVIVEHQNIRIPNSKDDIARFEVGSSEMPIANVVCYKTGPGLVNLFY